MHVHVHSESVFRQTAWSVGYCVRCGRFEAQRVGELVNVTSFYGFRVSSEKVGWAHYCDWCDRPVTPLPEALAIPLDAWSAAQGIQALFDKCGVGTQLQVPRMDSDSDIQSLLSWVQRRSALTRVNLGSGPRLGTLVGAGLGLVIGIGVAILGPFDRIRAVFLSLGAGLVLGLIVGVTYEVIVRGRHYASEKIAVAYHKYQLDPERLTALSQSYKGRIRAAVAFVLRQASSHES